MEMSQNKDDASKAIVSNSSFGDTSLGMGSNKIAFLGVKIFVNLGNRLSVKKTLPEAQRTDGATCISCKFGHQMAPLA